MIESEQLIRELRRALLHLDDLAYLETSPLVRYIAYVACAPEVSRGQLLRRALRLAIEALDPGPNVPANAREARPFQILRRHYVAKQTMEAIARNLDIDERYAYRELRRATEALAQILCEGKLSLDHEPVTGEASARAARVREEVERLSGVDRQELDLNQLVVAAVQSVQPLADARGIQVRLLSEGSGLLVAANRIMLRQAILNLLSHIICVHQGKCITVRLGRSENNAILTCVYCPRHSNTKSDPEEPYAVARHLFDSLGVRWMRDDLEDGTVQVAAYFPLAKEHVVLIVDDNSGTISLFRRYLQHEPYAIYAVSNAQEALEMAKNVEPDVLILDIMMPGLDGWEILERLRANHQTHKPRVIVCSIINDPQLSAALGADAFLHKPVTRSKLLQTLNWVLSLPST